MNTSPLSVKPPSRTSSSIPPRRGVSTTAPGTQHSSLTLSSVFSNNDATATPGIPATGAKETMEVSMRSCVRSSGSNYQSLTKIVQPGSEPGVWLLVGGLRT